LSGGFRRKNRKQFNQFSGLNEANYDSAGFCPLKNPELLGSGRKNSLAKASDEELTISEPEESSDKEVSNQTQPNSSFLQQTVDPYSSLPAIQNPQSNRKSVLPPSEPTLHQTEQFSDSSLFSNHDPYMFLNQPMIRPPSFPNGSTETQQLYLFHLANPPTIPQSESDTQNKPDKSQFKYSRPGDTIPGMLCNQQYLFNYNLLSHPFSVTPPTKIPPKMTGAQQSPNATHQNDSSRSRPKSDFYETLGILKEPDDELGPLNGDFSDDKLLESLSDCGLTLPRSQSNEPQIKAPATMFGETLEEARFPPGENLRSCDRNKDW